MKRKVIISVICSMVLATQVIVTPVIAKASEVQSYNLEERMKSENKNSEKAIHPNIIVDKEFTGVEGKKSHGTVTYTTLQKAIDSISENNKKEVKILIKNGTYYEKVNINKPNVTLIGEDNEKTILTYDAASGTVIPDENGGNGTLTYGTDGCATLMVYPEAKNFSVANVTIENSFDEASHMDMKNRQAVAMKDDADESMFVNCRFIGNQDTLYASTNRQYYKNCYIEGDVDFIFGAATAYFEKCEIFSLDRNTTPKGYVTAPSTLAESEFGFVIVDCKLTSNITEEGTVYLGRPWHPTYEAREVNSSVVYKNCEMGSHIAKDGWTTMRTNAPLDNNMFEYGSTGAGAITSEMRRVLTKDEINKYGKKNVLKGWNVKKQAKKLSSDIKKLNK